MLVFCSEDCPVLHIGQVCALLLSGPGPVRNGPCIFLSRRNHLCHMTVVFSCFALGCQDLYLEELESDWNPEPELCRGETECLHCYSKQRSASRRLRQGISQCTWACLSVPSDHHRLMGHTWGLMDTSATVLRAPWQRVQVGLERIGPGSQ